MMMLRRIFDRLIALLGPARGQTLTRAPAERNPRHIPISSYSRRYPGRTPAAELRRNLGWVAATANRSHRDLRA
jgi:hypothetical protein